MPIMASLILESLSHVYAGVMTNCNEAIRPVHNRMPVLLQPGDYEQWLHGSLDDIVSLQDRCFPDELITSERTSDLWINRSVDVSNSRNRLTVRNRPKASSVSV
jgi:putative SOS response-associated peptidase YedK